MKSIRRQLTLTMLCGFGLLVILSSLTIYFLTRIALLNEFDSVLRAKAFTIMSLAEQGHNGIQVEIPRTLFLGTMADENSLFFELWQTNGVVCARSESLKDASLPLHYGSQAQPLYWNFDLPNGLPGRAIGLKFVPQMDDEDVGKMTPVEAIVMVAADRRSLDRTLDILGAVLVVSGLLTIIITIPMVNITLRRGHAPLEELARQAAAINADSLKVRFPVDSLPDELRPIAGRLNDLLQRLESSFERERRFSADIAHELRTPLSELRALAEVELKWPDGEASEKHRETLNIALQMEAMVTQLLALARSEDGKIPLKIETVEIAPLVEEIWRPLAARAKEKNLVFNFDIPSGTIISTDRTLFHSILANLLSNAVEYTPRDGNGKIRWSAGAKELTVSNTVHDLTAADMPHLFERLWRKDKSRTDREHCGLGLVLCQTFAEGLGLGLKATLDNGTLTISLVPRSGA
jgi:two-component system sensor histidine kinase QseC